MKKSRLIFYFTFDPAELQKLPQLKADCDDLFLSPDERYIEKSHCEGIGLIVAADPAVLMQLKLKYSDLTVPLRLRAKC